MAGQPKRGLDFAGWSTHIFDDHLKIESLLDAQGWIGWSIYFYLCQKAYGTDGYFYRWGYADAVRTARKMGAGISSGTVKETVAHCLRIGLFDEGLFVGWGVLTNVSIQQVYMAAIKKRSREGRTVNPDLWLLNEQETKDYIIVPKNGHSLPENGHSLPENAHSRPQSKVKQSKVKESKVNNNPPLSPLGGKKRTTATAIREAGFDKPVADMLTLWVRYKNEKRQNYKETGFNALLARIRKNVERYGAEKVVDVIEKSMSQNYQGICWDWLKDAGGAESSADSLYRWAEGGSSD